MYRSLYIYTMRYTKVYYRIELAVWRAVIVPCGDRTIALEALARPVPPKDMLHLSSGTDVVAQGWPRKCKISRSGTLVQRNVKRAGETKAAHCVRKQPSPAYVLHRARQPIQSSQNSRRSCPDAFLPRSWRTLKVLWNIVRAIGSS